MRTITFYVALAAWLATGYNMISYTPIVAGFSFLLAVIASGILILLEKPRE